MALSFPLAVADFFDKIRVVEATPFFLTETLEYSQTRSGEILSADVGVRLWRTSIVARPKRHQDVKELRALLHLLSTGGRSFFAYDPTIPGPFADPQGTTLGANIPRINSLPSTRELTLKLLPAGYVISPGDMLSFTYGSSPTRYALHQVVTGATANGSGVTGNIEVMPYIRTGAAVNAVVTLIKPTCKMMLVPGSLNMGTSDILFTTGIGFEAVQTLR